ncbi:MAG: hypothetical protein K2X61_14935 [Caulobacteraceae bacterium]|nr:hypothetical protein [Caulobacteraceae bacterium]
MARIEDLTRKHPVPRPHWRVRLMVACGLGGLACLFIAIFTLLWLMTQRLDPRASASEPPAGGKVVADAGPAGR